MMIESSSIEWLLEAQTPSIRYLTLNRLLGLAETEPEVQAARQAMGATGSIPTILSRQGENGSWVGDKSYYTPKYTSAHWSMLLLAELEADPTDLRLHQGAAHMLEVILPELERRFGKGTYGWTCLWANILRYTLHARLAEDPHLEPVLAALLRDGLDYEWRCPYNDERPCAWGAARALWGLAALPPELHRPEVKNTIQSAIRFLLEEHDLLQANYPVPDNGKIHDLWNRLSFPLFYQADILFVLRALADANALDHPGAHPALDWLAQQRKSNGRWGGASPFRQRTWRVIGDRSETDRWVSLHAAIVLEQAGYGVAA
jgi:hypothetical protein